MYTVSFWSDEQGWYEAGVFNTRDEAVVFIMKNSPANGKFKIS